MGDILKIKCNCKSYYQYGIFHSGVDFLDYLFIENLSGESFHELKVSVQTAPNILLSGDGVLRNLAPFGYGALRCDFVVINPRALLSLSGVENLSVSVEIRTQEDKLLERTEFPCRLLPYYYYTGFSVMPETLAHFITPAQKELDAFISISDADPFRVSEKFYQDLKNLQISFSAKDYTTATPQALRLPEKVLKERFANSLELAVLFASLLEKAGLDSIILFAGKGKVFVGCDTVGAGGNDIFSKVLFSKKDLASYVLFDAAHLAYGSELSFSASLEHSHNDLILLGHPVTVFHVNAARRYHLLSLPPRTLQNGSYQILPEAEEEEKSGDFSTYYDLIHRYSEDRRISAILSEQKIPVSTERTGLSFQPDLDINQNKILSKILSNDFTLIRAQYGCGASTLFSHAAAHAAKMGKSVLYLTSADYHAGDFEENCARFFDSSFVLNLMESSTTAELSKSEIKGLFSQHDNLFEQRKICDDALKQRDLYYEICEGKKSIVSSFLFASDRYEKLKDANDSVIFSPDQVGLLSDEMVQNWFNLVGEMTKSFTEIGTIFDNPLRHIHQRNFTYEYKSKLITTLEDILRCTETIISERDYVLSSFPSLGGARASGVFYAFLDLTRLFSEFSVLPRRFFEDPRCIEDNFRNVTRLIQAKNENSSIYESVAISFDPAIFQMDAIDLFDRYQELSADRSFKSLSQKHGILKNIKNYLKPNCDVENIEEILSRLAIYQKNRAFLENEQEAVFNRFSLPFTDDKKSWDALQFASDLCYQGYSIFQSYFSIDRLPDFVTEFSHATARDDWRDRLANLRREGERFRDLKVQIEELFANQLHYAFPHADKADADYFFVLHEEFSSILSAAGRVKDWCAWLNVRERAMDLGLKNMVMSMESGKISPDELKRGFLRAFFKAVCEYNFIAHPQLVPGNFDFEENMQTVRQAFVKIKKQRVSENNSVLSVRRFDALSEWKEDVFSPEKLLRSDPKLYVGVYPVTVATIDSAKRFLLDSEAKFDYVFIENRSRIALSDIIWALSVGSHVAFAGGFYYGLHRASYHFDLKESAFDYLWQIAEEKYGLSACYRTTPVLTAARAAFASGIDSDSRLYTVPATHAGQAIQLVRVSGAFNEEYPGANFAEAKAVVQFIVDFIEQNAEKTLAVIAATVKQKDLILHLLAKSIQTAKETSKMNISEYRRVFIYAVGEKTQLCDHLVFSATFAPDRSLPGAGIPYEFLTFLGKDPKRRVYRLLSGARESVTIFAGFAEEELKYSATSLPIETAFQLLFDLTRTQPCNNTYMETGPIGETAFVSRVSMELATRGFSTLRGIQSGRYYIDLAVLSPEGEFLLGILSDRSVMNQKDNISAIELANTDLYQQNGWKIYRLRNTNCFDSFDKELDRILSLLNSGENQEDLIENV